MKLTKSSPGLWLCLEWERQPLPAAKKDTDIKRKRYRNKENTHTHTKDKQRQKETNRDTKETNRDTNRNKQRHKRKQIHTDTNRNKYRQKQKQVKPQRETITKTETSAPFAPFPFYENHLCVDGSGPSIEHILTSLNLNKHQKNENIREKQTSKKSKQDKTTY